MDLSWLESILITLYLLTLLYSIKIKRHPGKILSPDKKTAPFSQPSSSFLPSWHAAAKRCYSSHLATTRREDNSDGDGLENHCELEKAWSWMVSLSHCLDYPPPDIMFSTSWVLVLSHLGQFEHFLWSITSWQIQCCPKYKNKDFQWNQYSWNMNKNCISKLYSSYQFS